MLYQVILGAPLCRSGVAAYYQNITVAVVVVMEIHAVEA